MQVSSFPNTIRRAGKIDVESSYVQARPRSGAFRPKSSYDGLFDVTNSKETARQPIKKQLDNVLLPDKLPSRLRRNQSTNRYDYGSDSDPEIEYVSKHSLNYENDNEKKSRSKSNVKPKLHSSQSFMTPSQERSYIDEQPCDRPEPSAPDRPPEPKPRSKTSKSFSVYNKSDPINQENLQKMRQRNLIAASNPFLVQSVNFSDARSGKNDRKLSYQPDSYAITTAPEWGEDNGDQNVAVIDSANNGRPLTEFDAYSYYETPRNDLSHSYFSLLHEKRILKFIDKIAPNELMIRSRVYVTKGVFNEYMMQIDGNSSNESYPILVTRRKKSHTNLFYYVNVIERNSPLKFGRLTANFTRSKYMLIGNLKPKSPSLDDENGVVGPAESAYFDEQESGDGGLIRKYFELEYFNKVFGQAKPKDIQMDMSVKEDDDETSEYVSSSVSRLRRGESTDSSNMPRRRVNKHLKLTTKKPIFDPESRTFRSDFEGRARLPSTNNVQMALESDPDRVVWQLGKWDSKCFNVDYSYPFNAFSAFSLAISCLSRN